MRTHFEDWLKWLNKKGTAITTKHEDFIEHYQNLETPEKNYKRFKEYISEKYACPRCGNKISQKQEDISEGYFVACLECDEDFYSFEI